jgi:hypothetical protein
MALTFLNEPGAVSLVKNPVVFELSTNNRLSTAGVTVKQSIALNQIPAIDDTLTLEWLNGTRDITFTFKAVPDDSGLELQTGGFVTVQQYIEDSLLDELRKNYFINNEFDVSYLFSDKVLFEAKATGVNYAFTLSKTGTYTPTLDVFQQGVDAVPRENFRIISQVHARYQGDSNWDNVELELLPVDEQVIFDLHHVLVAYDKMRLCPAFRTTPLDISNQVIECKANFAEAFGTTLAVQANVFKTLRHGLFGGYDLRDRLAVDFNSDKSREFLTWRLKQRIRVSQAYFLYYYHNAATDDLNLKAKLFFNDGTHETVTVHALSAVQYGLYCLPVGFVVLNGAQSGVKTLTKAEVFLQEDGGAWTNDAITLTIDREPRQDEIVLAYRNSFGVAETVAFTGEITLLHKAEKQHYNVYQKYNAGADVPRFKELNAEYHYGLELNSGFFDADEAEYMADLLGSDLVFLVINGQYLPCRLEVGETSIRRTNSDTNNAFSLKVFLTRDLNYSDAGSRII